MADYYTNASFQFDCTMAEAECLNAALALDAEENFAIPPILIPFFADRKDAARKIFQDKYEDWFSFGLEDFNYDDGKFWMSATNLNIEAIALLIQTLAPSALPVGFEWSNDCSKHRLDGFGGGWCAIFPDRIEIENTGEALAAALSGGIL